ncbi:hypothetical protein EIP91_010636 [Steccherinum ochraceum]|uniref:F-box domain-containing protein n=1 Tax=Steccherinum ochraceum TaxID=92696 RepID=A0A4R0R2X8_9APHY|nr:hypothetical protein EIP91_010636 [Steccherinum ochraceum]
MVEDWEHARTKKDFQRARITTIRGQTDHVDAARTRWRWVRVALSSSSSSESSSSSTTPPPPPTIRLVFAAMGEDLVTSSPPSTALELPPELWDLILSLLRQDIHSLSSCSLTSRHIHQLALPYMFSKLAVASQAFVRHPKHFLSFTLKSPLVASHIQDLTIESMPRRPNRDPRYFIWPQEMHVDRLAEILQTLPSLRRLVISCVLRDTDHPPFDSSIIPKAKPRRIEYLSLHTSFIKESPCVLISLIRVLSLFSVIDHLVLGALPDNTHDATAYAHFDAVFRLRGHTLPPNLTIHSIKFGMGHRLTTRRAVSKLLARCAIARSSSLPPGSCSLDLLCGHRLSPEMCSELIEAYGPRLGRCSLSLETAICHWPIANAPFPPSDPVRHHRIDLSSSTALTSLSLTGVWNIPRASVVAPNSPNASFALLDILGSAHPSAIHHLSIDLVVWPCLSAPTPLVLNDVVRPMIDWRGLRRVLQEKLATLHEFTLKWSLGVPKAYDEAVAEWMRKTVEQELGQWVKSGVLKFETTTRSWDLDDMERRL